MYLCYYYNINIGEKINPDGFISGELEKELQSIISYALAKEKFKIQDIIMNNDKLLCFVVNATYINKYILEILDIIIPNKKDKFYSYTIDTKEKQPDNFIIESGSIGFNKIINLKTKEIQGHAITGFRLNNKFYLIDSNYPNIFYPCEWYNKENLINCLKNIYGVNIIPEEPILNLYTHYLNEEYIEKNIPTTEELIYKLKKLIEIGKKEPEFRELLEKSNLEGGGNKKYIKYNKRKYVVRIDKKTNLKYIKTEGKVVKLADIRGKYRYC